MPSPTVVSPAHLLTAQASTQALTRRRWRISSSPAWFGLPALIALCMVNVYPLLVSIQMSLSQVDIGTINSPWPFVGLDNFVKVMTAQSFLATLEHTILYVVLVVSVGLAGGLVAALALRLGGRLVTAVGALMLFVWSLPPVVNGSLWKFSYADDGPVNAVLKHVGIGPLPWLVDGHLALLAVALVNAWVAVPFTSAILRAALLDVPVELYEASALDGASRGQQFRFVTLPLLRPAVAVLAVLMVLNAFRSFDYIYVMTSGGPGDATTTLPYLSYTQSFVTYQFGQGAATSIIAIIVVLPIALYYLYLRRRETLR